MDVVIYARYSSKNQTELSIDGQLRECVNYAEKHGYNIVENYIDRALSGTNAEREALQDMMKDAKHNSFDAVLVYKFNRFFRDRTEAAIYRKELGKNDVKLISISEAVPEGRGGIFYQAILEAEAEAYSVGLSEDVRRGMYDAARKCQALGPLPYGLKSNKDKKIIIAKKEADVVRQIFEMYLDGNNPNEIALKLNTQGAKTKINKQFQGGYIYRILKNEKYCGKYIYNSEVISNNGIPKIISKLDFEKVQEKLFSKHSKHVISSDDKYLLSGVVYCGCCGEKYIGDSSYSGTKKMYRYYSCKNKKQRRTCKAKSISKLEFENHVMTQIFSCISLGQIKLIAKDFYGSNYQKKLNKNLKEVNRKIRNIANAISDGIVTATTKELLVATENEKKCVEKEIEKATPSLMKSISDYPYKDFLFDLKNQNSNYNFKKVLITACIRTINVEKSQKIEIIYRNID